MMDKKTKIEVWQFEKGIHSDLNLLGVVERVVKKVIVRRQLSLAYTAVVERTAYMCHIAGKKHFVRYYGEEAYTAAENPQVTLGSLDPVPNDLQPQTRRRKR
jgi:hypothetical protein